MRILIDTEADDLPDVLDLLAKALVGASDRTPTRAQGDRLIQAQELIDGVLDELEPGRTGPREREEPT